MAHKTLQGILGYGIQLMFNFLSNFSSLKRDRQNLSQGNGEEWGVVDAPAQEQ